MTWKHKIIPICYRGTRLGIYPIPHNDKIIISDNSDCVVVRNVLQKPVLLAWAPSLWRGIPCESNIVHTLTVPQLNGPIPFHLHLLGHLQLWEYWSCDFRIEQEHTCIGWQHISWQHISWPGFISHKRMCSKYIGGMYEFWTQGRLGVTGWGYKSPHAVDHKEILFDTAATRSPCSSLVGGSNDLHPPVFVMLEYWMALPRVGCSMHWSQRKALHVDLPAAVEAERKEKVISNNLHT